MKNNKFYHSHVKINEYPFPKFKVNNLSNELINIIQQFNSSKNIIEKQNLAKNISIEFPKCRICGDDIINSNFIIKIFKRDKNIQIIHPSIYCREIDGNKYYLSCCKKCLLEHFKDNPPKAEKYYFMKANKYGQYSFGYSEEEYKKICSMVVGVTHDSMINKWGKELGEQKWKEYCDKRSYIASKKWFIDKYGEKDGLIIYNKSRSITLKHMIEKYGKEIGTQKFNDYCNKQKITKSFDYMVKKFGEKKAYEINKSKAITIENFIKKYGENEGLSKFENTINKHNIFYSKISQVFFDQLDSILSKKYTTYYATKNQEYGIMLSNKIYVKLDYFIKELNLCIEFNGDNFHANPKIYKENDNPNPFNKKITAKEIWENDNNRYKLLKETRNINTIIVWESEYNKGIDINDFIKNILKITI